MLLLEREEHIYPLPRAVHFDDEIMRVFQTVGVANTLLNKLFINKGMRFCDNKGRLLLDWPRPQTKAANGWNARYRFDQPDLEKALREALSRFPGLVVKTRHAAERIEQNASHLDALVTVTYRDLANDSTARVASCYAVGCDGARSHVRVRELLQIEMQKLGIEQRWLVVDLLLKRDMPELGDHTLQFCDPVRPATYCRDFGDRRRWESALQHNECDTDMLVPESVWHLLTRWISPEDAELERSAIYTFKSEVARQWRRNRIFLAGDAAHLTRPFMGQGMCAGMRDAANLAWKLSVACRHESEPQLLDSYETERRSNVVEYIERAVKLGELINQMGVQAEWGSSQKTSSIDSRLGAGLGDSTDPLRGRQFPQCRLQNGQLLDDVIGFRPLLVSLDVTTHSNRVSTLFGNL